MVKISVAVALRVSSEACIFTINGDYKLLVSFLVPNLNIRHIFLL